MRCWGAYMQTPHGVLGQLARGREPGELPLHLVDLREVVADVVIAAPLAGCQPEAAPCIGIAGPGSAEVDHCGQILLLPERDGGDPLAPHHACDASIQSGRGQLDRVARYNACIEAVEPA